jgi:hypothetical protein
VLPYGIDYQCDIKRLSGTMGFSVGTFFDVSARTGEDFLDCPGQLSVGGNIRVRAPPGHVLAPAAKYQIR